MRMLYELNKYSSKLYMTFSLEEYNMKAKTAVQRKLGKIPHVAIRVRRSLENLTWPII